MTTAKPLPAWKVNAIAAKQRLTELAERQRGARPSITTTTRDDTRKPKEDPEP